ncbi:MAG TPA: transporter [Crocinitomicaceae bacterium]|nr:polyphosphate polymerase domain-containing protein [Flavobacteriales bacterium]HBW85801.1 transporter [Crocinitomicaceae bacterium]
MFSLNLENILATLEPISLAEMDRVKLMNRTDTKFAFHHDKLASFLSEMNSHYQILTINGTSTPHYESLYFDDHQFRFFKDHHNGKGDRFKVRIRKYVESNLFFLEIKHKFKGRTDKKRIETLDFHSNFDSGQKEFILKQMKEDVNLQPTMWNSFQRITLVHKTLNERLTLDFNIEFHFDNIEKKFPHLIIAELKQEGLNRNSPFYVLMKAQRIRPYRLSKYCLGSIELYGEEKLKFNRFKKKLLFLNKIENNEH